MLQNVYNNYEKEIVTIINIITPLNFIGVSKIINAYLFNNNIHLQHSELIDFTHKIIANNLINYRVE